MIRNLKALGLAVVAVLAMSAVAASAAQAEGELTVEGGGTAELHGEQSGAQTFTLPGGRVLSCTTAIFTGSAANGATEATITPTYSGCSATIGESVLPATITFKSCDFRFVLGARTFLVFHHLKKIITCSTSPDTIEIHLYLNHTAHTLNLPLCTYKIAPQTVTGDVGSNMAGSPNDITVEAVNVAVAMTRTFGTLGNCGAVNSTGLYNGNTTVTGKVGGESKGILLD